MKYVFPEITSIFETKAGYVNTLVIENKKFFSEVVSDIYNQTNGDDGKSVISEGIKILSFTKDAELLGNFLPFDINRKSLITKIQSAIEKKTTDAEFCYRCNELLGEIENYLNDVVFDFPCDLVFSKINNSSLVKMAGIEIRDEYVSRAEKLLDYFELVREFDKDKLFFTVNLRSYLSDVETEKMMETIKTHRFNVIMIESTSLKLLQNEKRVTVDEDLCEI